MASDPHPVLGKMVNASDAINQRFRAPHLAARGTAWLPNEACVQSSIEGPSRFSNLITFQDCQTILQIHRFHWLPKQWD